MRDCRAPPELYRRLSHIWTGEGHYQFCVELCLGNGETDSSGLKDSDGGDTIGVIHSILLKDMVVA